MTSVKAVYIWGAPTIDWLNVANYGLDNERSYFWPLHRLADVHLTAQPGGSALLGHLLADLLPEDICIALTKNDRDILEHFRKTDGQHAQPMAPLFQQGQVCCGATLPMLTHDYSRYRHNWTLWKKFNNKEDKSKKKSQVYR